MGYQIVVEIHILQRGRNLLWNIDICNLVLAEAEALQAMA